MTKICYFWDLANIKWKNTNWKWAECFELVDTGSEICYSWNLANVKWKNTNRKWNECLKLPDAGSGICYAWNSPNVKWKDTKWMWSKCFTSLDVGTNIFMTNICYLWSSANVKWKDANWKWSECFMSPDTGSGICYLWSTANVLWKDANWMWSKCFFPPTPPVTGSVGNLPGIDATTLIPDWLEEPWNPYRAGEIKEKKLGLICRIDGIKYEKEKKSKKVSLTVRAVQVTMNEPNVDVEFKLEE